MKPGITTILFDIDDTLFDRGKAQRKIIGRIMDIRPDLFHGMDRDGVIRAFFESDQRALAEYHVGYPTRAFRDLRSGIFLSQLGLDSRQAPGLSEMYVDIYATMNTPVDGARAVVETLSHGYALGIISNGFPDLQAKKVESVGLERHFRCMVLSEVFGAAKPDPTIFKHALTLLTAEPSRSVYVGDSFENDVVGAKGAGLLSCWFNPENAPAPRADTHPDFEIKRLDEISDCIRT